MQPSDVLLDVACGSLRGGRLFIPYLQPGHYIGLDKHPDLIRRGIRKELDPSVRNDKQPRFVITATFDIPPLDPPPTFALAQSLFSHLTAADAEMCLRKVRERVADGCRFFVTFKESAEPVAASLSHSRRTLYLTREQMETIGSHTGWAPHYIGDWGHPRDQHLIEYVAS